MNILKWINKQNTLGNIPNMVIRILITVVLVVFIVIHMIYPNLNMDSITIVLLVLAMLPWATQIIGKIEVDLPGGLVIKLEEITNIMEQKGLIQGAITKKAVKLPSYSFQLIGEDDPNLALAGLRIEIEKRLRKLGEKNGIGTQMQSIGQLLQTLSNENLIGQQERSILADLIELLNEAVHGAKMDQRAYSWALDFGPRILKALDEKIEK